MKSLRITLLAAAPLALAGVLLAQPGYQVASCAASTVLPAQLDTLSKFTSSQLTGTALSTLSGRRDYKDTSRPDSSTTGQDPRTPELRIEPTQPAAITGLGSAPKKTLRSCL